MKCQPFEINSLVMTTLEGENNTGEKVGKEKGVIELDRNRKGGNERMRRKMKTFPFFCSSL